MSLLLMLLAVFFGIVVWCSGTRLWQMLHMASAGPQASDPRQPLAVTARTASD